MKKTGRRQFSGETLQAYLYLSPALLIFLAFTIGPTLFVIYISFFDWNFLNMSASNFGGLENYLALLASASFWHSLLITLYFVIVSVPTGVFISLGIALLLMSRFPGRSFLRLAIFSPYVTPVVATSIVWIWIFHPQFGLLNGALRVLHLPALGWLQSPYWAMPGVAMYSLWHQIGFNVVIFMAGLIMVPQELLEAARIDGAGKWREFWSVTWPLLSPTTLFVVVVNTIGAMQAFTQFYTMTQGGPLEATTTTSYLLYENAFVFFHTGYAAALSVVLFIIIALFTLVQMLLSQKHTFYQ